MAFSRRTASSSSTMPLQKRRIDERCSEQSVAWSAEVGSTPSAQPNGGLKTVSSGRSLKQMTRRSSSMFSMNEHSVVKDKLVIVMVGLPARGKSYISKALLRYLNFLGCPTKLFNAGNLRRDAGFAGTQANFFDAQNVAAKTQREQMAMECLEELLQFLRTAETAAVGILDATNTTLDRRSKVQSRCQRERGVRILFLESVCEDPEILKVNYQLKLQNPDYIGMDPASALLDFEERVRKYQEVYEPVQDDECSGNSSNGYIKLIDAGHKFVFYRCDVDTRSLVQGRVVALLHSIHLGTRSIFLALMGETENDAIGLLGGDSPLTHAGSRYGRALAAFLAKKETKYGSAALVMCGTLTRHLQVAEYLKVAHLLQPPVSRVVLKLQRLNELCAGSMDCLSYEDMVELYPEEFARRNQDKLNYRYPGVGGESYQDLVLRLHECILRLEQLHGSAIVICDKAVCRVLLAYFRGTNIKEMPFIKIQPGVIQLERAHGGFNEIFHPAQEVLDTAFGLVSSTA